MAADPSSASPTAGAHHALLDWLRFLAALLVVLCHARPEHWVAWNELAPDNLPLARVFFLLIRPGPEAVVVFFVLSGYLVGGKLLQRVGSGDFRAADYFIDRATRIFTPLLGAIPLTIACVWYLNRGFPAGFGFELLGNLAQFQGVLVERLTGNAPLWSLSYEVWFYVLGGALALLATRRAELRVASIAWISAGLAAWCLLILDTVYLACWVLGALAYAYPPAKRGGAWPWLAAAGIAGATALCQATGAYQGALWMASRPLHIAGVLILGASVARLLPWLAAPRTSAPSSRWLGLGPALAAFSYTLYLTHYPVLLLLRSTHQPHRAFDAASLGGYFLKVAACLLVAWLLYLPFERQTPLARRSLRRLIFGKASQPAAPTA